MGKRAAIYRVSFMGPSAPPARRTRKTMIINLVSLTRDAEAVANAEAGDAVPYHDRFPFPTADSGYIES